LSQLILYAFLLLAGLVCLVLHYTAPFRVARQLRLQHPQQWRIVDGHGDARGLRLWVRMQHVLRSPAIQVLADPVVTRWWRVWRYSQWLAWACWLVALALQWVRRA
jgi:hypothetical protein